MHRPLDRADDCELTPFAMSTLATEFVVNVIELLPKGGDGAAFSDQSGMTTVAWPLEERRRMIANIAMARKYRLFLSSPVAR